MNKAAIAIIEKDGKILIARRRTGDLLKGKWEFPGGKIHEGETPGECVKREIREELDIDVEAGDLLHLTQHTYNDVAIELYFFETRYLSGEIKLKEYRDIRWVEKKDLRNYDFPEASLPLLNILERDI
jgi:mutator protein MutT